MATYYIALIDDGSGNFNTVAINAPTTIASGGRNLSIPKLANLGSLTQFTISAATNATPIVCTAAGHTFVNGDTVYVSGALVNTGANGTFVVSAVSGNNFTLTNSVGNGTYTASSGIANLLVTTKSLHVTIQAAVRAVLNDRAG